MRRRVATRRAGVAGIALVVLLSGCASEPRSGVPPAAISPASGGTDRSPVLYGGLGDAEIALAEAAVQEALENNPSRHPASWRSEVTGRAGTVTPVRTFRAAEGFFCREFEETVVSPNETRSAVRLACRARDGRWRPASLARAD